MSKPALTPRLGWLSDEIQAQLKAIGSRSSLRRSAPAQSRGRPNAVGVDSTSVGRIQPEDTAATVISPVVRNGMSGLLRRARTGGKDRRRVSSPRRNATTKWLKRLSAPTLCLAIVLPLWPHMRDAALQWSEVVGHARGDPPLVRASAGPIKILAYDTALTHEPQGGRDGIASLEAKGHGANKPAKLSTEATHLPIYRIQLASFRDDSETARIVDLETLEESEVVQGLETVIERANVADATFYRVQVGSFQNRLEAEAVCDGLRRRDTACVVVRR